MEVRKIIAIPARCAARLSVCSGGKEETMAARMENVQTNTADPNTNGFFRPIRSRSKVMKLLDTLMSYGDGMSHR